MLSHSIRGEVRVIPGDRGATRDPFRSGSGMDPGSSLRYARDDRAFQLGRRLDSFA